MAEIITIHATFGKAVLKEIAITQLHSGLYQPRDIFAQETLESLSKTIEQLGVLEPLIVRVSPKNINQYEIVAGERRYRAAKLAGLQSVPCLLSNYSNEQAAQIALIENTHREALNPIAEALAMKRLSEEFHYTHDEIGVLLGVSRAQVTNYLRLLTLEARVQHWMKQGALSTAHGKILAGIKYEDQYAFAYDAIKNSWSVHTLDKIIKTKTIKKSSAKIKSNIRFQDDVLVLCKTKRQLNRCKRKMMEVLNERHLRISKRKTRMGEIEKTGFHFLGIEYPPTRMADNTNVTPVLLKKEKEITSPPDHYLREGGGRINSYFANTGCFAHAAHGSTCANAA